MAGSSPSAQVVGNAFVHQYYHILHNSPEFVFRFYQESSKLGRPETDGLMSSITTMQAINEKILSLGYGGCGAEIKTVDAQESLDGGVIVLVTGYLTGKDNVRRTFTQSFFLATQDKGYFVLNDMFRYMEDDAHHGENCNLVSGTVVPLTPEQDHQTPALEHQISEHVAAVSEEVEAAEACDPSVNDGPVVEEAPATPINEVVDETQNNSQPVADSSSTVQEGIPRKSYASILKVMKEKLFDPASAPVRSMPNPERQVTPSPAPSLALETPAPNSTSTDSSGMQEAEGDGHSIYIRGLPMNANAAQLEEEFKCFGPIKSGGVQVRSNKLQGVCFGFVEFEVASAVQSAIEASPLIIGDREAHVEEKRPSSRVNNRGRFPPGRGTGFRNDGQRARGGNYNSTRNYSRGDFSNRADFVNRSSSRTGSSNRGGNGGYQRVDHIGTNSGPINRSSGPAVNATAKRIAPQVSASA